MVTISQEVLDGITQRLVAALKPERIYLFGSHAYGVPEPGSDVDIMLVMPRAEATGTDLSHEARQAIGLKHVPVDVVIRWSEDFDRRATWPSSLEATIRSKGRLLYG